MIVANAFCPTGKGGGVDPTCGKGSNSAPPPGPALDKFLQEHLTQPSLTKSQELRLVDDGGSMSIKRTGGSYFADGPDWNKKLREEAFPSGAMFEVDDVIMAAPVKKDFIMYRGVSNMNFKEGDVLEDAGYVSGTLYDYTASGYASSAPWAGSSNQNPTVVRMKVPKDHPALYLETMLVKHSGTDEDMSGIHEVVLPRGSVFRITKVSQGVVAGDKRTIVDAEVVLQ